MFDEQLFASPSGKDTILLLVWAYCVRRSRPHMFIQECTPRFPMQVLVDTLGTYYDIQSRIICPTQLGGGALRARQWSVGTLRSAVEVVHRFDGDLFARLFHRQSVMTAEDYFVAPVAERGDAVKAMLPKVRIRSSTRQHRGLQGGEPLHLLEVLTPGALCRLEGYERLAKSHPKFQDKKVLCADISQHPDCQMFLHSKVKTLMRSAQIVLLRAERRPAEELPLLMTADEHLGVMGIPMHAPPGGAVNLLRDCVTSLNDAEKNNWLAMA